MSNHNCSLIPSNSSYNTQIRDPTFASISTCQLQQAQQPQDRSSWSVLLLERSFKSVTSTANSGFIPFHSRPTLWLLSCDQFSSHLPPMGKAIAGERSETRLLYPPSPPHHRKIKKNIKNIKKQTQKTQVSRIWERMVRAGKGPTFPGRRSPGQLNKSWKNLKSYNPTRRRERKIIFRNQPNVARKRKHESSKTKPEGYVQATNHSVTT